MANLITALWILLFIVLAIFSLCFTVYNLKNEKKLKKTLMIISTVILVAVASLNTYVQGRCFFVGCDGFGEGMVSAIIIIPFTLLVIVPWTIYWLIKRFS